MRRLLMIVLAITSLSATPADAQSSLEGQIGVGVGFAPDYEGSDEFDPIPIVPLSLRYEGFGIQSAGRGIQIDVSGYEFIDFGPLFQFRGPRDSDVEDPVVSLLPPIDAAYEVGGFVEINLPFIAPGKDALTFIGRVSFDVSGAHDGYTIDTALRYSVPIGEKLRINLIGATTLASDNYNDTYFSVTPAGAAASGLRTFRAEGGLKDFSGTIAATYLVTDHWGFTAIAQYTNLVGDASDSPLVEDRGSRHQFLGGIALTYKF
ncbi:MAG: MipA/OmpV family protein [Pseudomonadota bacterium]